MVRRLLTATGVAAAVVLCHGTTAGADELSVPPIIGGTLIDGALFTAMAFEGGDASGRGNWSLAIVADLGTVGGSPVGDTNTRAYSPADQSSDRLVGSLGVRGAARVDSRFGAIYSRLSLSFEHVFHTSAHQTVSGLSGGGRNGYYANRSEIDVMTLDAAFAMQLAKDVTAFLDYGAEVDPGSGIEHQALMRLKFGF